MSGSEPERSGITSPLPRRGVDSFGRLEALDATNLFPLDDRGSPVEGPNSHASGVILDHGDIVRRDRAQRDLRVAVTLRVDEDPLGRRGAAPVSSHRNVV